MANDVSSFITSLSTGHQQFSNLYYAKKCGWEIRYYSYKFISEKRLLGNKIFLIISLFPLRKSSFIKSLTTFCMGRKRSK